MSERKPLYVVGQIVFQIDRECPVLVVGSYISRSDPGKVIYLVSDGDELSYELSEGKLRPLTSGMSGIEALRCLLIGRMPIRHPTWPHDGFLRMNGIHVVDEKDRVVPIGTHDWTTTDWEVFDAPLSGPHDFHQIFDLLGPGKHATSSDFPYCQLFLDPIGNLRQRLMDGAESPWLVSKEVLNAKYFIRKDKAQ